MTDVTSVHAAILAATTRLESEGVPSPRNDAELLAAQVLGVDRSGLVTAGDFTSTQIDAFDALVARRGAREPLQHITGIAWFRHVGLAVGPGVFVPRPETELVAGVAIDEACRVARAGGGVRPVVVVDLCTGSGAIAAAVADELGRAGVDARIHAVELSASAHAYAERNLAPFGVDLRLGDVAGAFADLDGTADVVVSNPPYIPDGASIRDPEVAEHDPALALWGGADGLDVVRVVVTTAARLLCPGGLVAIEHADVQGASVPALLRSGGSEQAGWRDVFDHQDLAARDRYTTARRTTESER